MKDNYYKLKRKLALGLLGLILIATIGSHSVLAQTNICDIRVDFEPKVKQLRLPLSVSALDSEDDRAPSTLKEDSIYYQLTLDSFANHSLTFVIENLNINEGTEIYGVAVNLTGYQEYHNSVQVDRMQFFDESGDFIGVNKAGKNVYGSELPTSQGSWQYGHGTDKWGFDANQILKVNSKTGFQIDLINASDSSASVAFDKAELIIFYKELYTICDHYCSTFYVDAQPGINYDWDYGENVNITSESEHSSIINLDFTKAEKGVQTICVNAGGNYGLNELCCREIYIDTCGLSEITGVVWKDNDANGIRSGTEAFFPDIEVILYNIDDEAIDTSVTSETGHYQFELTAPGYYYVEMELPNNYISAPFQIGAGELDNDGLQLKNKLRTVFTFVPSVSVVANLDFGIYQVESELKVHVYNDLFGDLNVNTSNPLPNHIIVLNNLEGNFVTQVNTDSIGIACFSSLEPGEYSIQVLLENGFNYSQSYNQSILENILVTLNSNNHFEIFLISYSSIGDFVWEDKNRDGLQDSVENGVADFNVRLIDSLENIIEETFTDENGSYLFDSLFPGLYSLEFESPESYDFTIIAEPDSINSDVYQEDGKTDNIFLVSGTKLTNIDAGLVVQLGEIRGFVWGDEDMDGLQDDEELGLEGIQVNLLNATGNIIQFVWSNVDGYYSFKDLNEGTYKVSLASNPGFQLTMRIDGNEGINSDLNPDRSSDLIDIRSDNLIILVDIGLFQCSGAIGDFVWMDENRNGLQDENEIGINNIQVFLRNNDSIVQETSTNPSGHYWFENVSAGEYIVEFRYDYTYRNTISVDNPASNTDVVVEQNLVDSNFGFTEIFFLEDCEIKTDIDLGLVSKQSFIEGQVWDDMNHDGVFDPFESGFDNVEVLLFDSNNQLLDQTTSISNENNAYSGIYSFQGNYVGRHYIVFQRPENYLYSLVDSTNQSMGTDVTGENGEGSTDSFFIDEGQSITGLDCGLYYGLSTIGDFVWLDNNTNGLQDINEIGINNIQVVLFQDEERIDSTLTEYHPITGIPGYYALEDVMEGNYHLSFVIPLDYKFTIPNAVGENENSKVTGTNGEGTTNIFFLEGGKHLLNLDCGIYDQEIGIGDFVWLDKNENGIQDTDESGISNVKIVLFSALGNKIDSTFTDEFGHYSFGDIGFGQYYLEFEKVAGYKFTLSDILNDELDSDADEDGRTTIFTIDSEGIRSDLDCGYVSLTFVGDFIWNDLNKDGIQNNEPGFPNVKVSIYNLDDELLGSTISDEEGRYAFYGLVGGEYYLAIEIPTDFQVSIPNVANDLIDNDALSEGITENFLLGSNEKNESIDIGLFAITNIFSGVIFHDENYDQVKSLEEIGYGSRIIKVINDEERIVYEVKTNYQGQFDIGVLPEGRYTLRTDLPNDHHMSFVKGSNIIDTEQGEAIFFSKGERLTNLDLGFYGYARLTFRAWNDENGSGTIDGNEGDIKNVTGEIFDEKDNYISTLKISNKEFNTLNPGSYRIRIPKSTSYILTDSDVGINEIVDNDFIDKNEYYESPLFTILSFELRKDVTAGFYYPGSVGNRVWLDENNNGIQDENEVGIVNAKVRLYNKAHELIDSCNTGSDGSYSFNGLKKGGYYLNFEVEGPYEFTTVDDNNEQMNSDVVNAMGHGNTPSFNIVPGERKWDKDAGVVLGEVLFSELMEFTGRRNGGENFLTWTTKSEKLISKYILERRKDGDREFEAIAEISSIDQEKEYQEYVYFDGSVEEEGNYYYRLKEYDIDGNYSYSHITVIKVLYDVFTFNVSPNPALDHFYIDFELAETSKVTIHLLDESGRTIETIKDYEEVEIGVYNLAVKIDHFPRGFYVLQMIAGHRTYHEKLIINNN